MRARLPHTDPIAPASLDASREVSAVILPKVAAFGRASVATEVFEVQPKLSSEGVFHGSNLPWGVHPCPTQTESRTTQDVSPATLRMPA